MLQADLRVWTGYVVNCYKCDIANLCGRKVKYRPAVTKPVDVVLVGEAPGQSEHICHEPFVGIAGEELNTILAESIPAHVSFLITNAILCTPFVDDDLDEIRQPSLSEVNACRPHLEKLLEILKPKVVIALGKVASRSLKPICPEHIQVMHPSGILQSSHPALERQRAILKIQNAVKDL